MKLIKYEDTKEGEKFPTNVLISFGPFSYNRFYIQFQSPFKSLDTFEDFMLRQTVTRYRRKTWRFIIRYDFGLMEELK